MNKPKLKVVTTRNAAWKNFTMPIHVITLIAGIIGASAACAAYMGIISPGERFAKTEIRQDKLESDVGDIRLDMASIKVSVGRIEQKIDDIKRK